MGISEELYILLNAVWTGCIVCSVGEFLAVLRKMISHRDIIVVIEDLFFWIFTSVYIFIQVFETNSGTWRWYFVIGIVLGCWSTHTIWYRGEKLLQNVRKSLKMKIKRRIIK